MANDRINFYYDPTRQGLDTTLWKVLGGAPSYAAGAITLNASSMIGYADVFKADLTMTLVIPAAPLAGDTRQWGFKHLADNSGLWFDVDGEGFTCKAQNADGTVETVTADWQAAWTGVAVDWKIVWTGFSAKFLVNGVQLAETNATRALIAPRSLVTGAGVPKTPLSVYLRNDNADNMDLYDVDVQNAQGYV